MRGRIQNIEMLSFILALLIVSISCYIFWENLYRHFFRPARVPSNLLDKDVLTKSWTDSHFMIFKIRCQNLKWRLMKKLGNSLDGAALNVLRFQYRRWLYDQGSNLNLDSELTHQILNMEDPDSENAKLGHCFKTHIFYPSEIEADKFSKVVFLYHGSGWCVCRPDKSHYKFCQLVAKKLNRTVIAVDYSKSPEFPFSETKPSPFYDCWRSTKLCLEKFEISDYMLLGDSAGGNLVLGVAHKIADHNAAAEDPVPIPKFVVPIYPATQFVNFNTDSYMDSDYPNLPRRGVIDYDMAYMMGACEEEIIDLVDKDGHEILNWKNFSQEQRESLGVSTIGQTLAQHQNLSNRAKHQISKFADKINKFSNPLLTKNEEDISSFVGAIEHGIILVCAEHDSIRSDSELFDRKFRKHFEDEGKVFDFAQIDGGWHGMFSAAPQVPKVMPESFGEVSKFLDRVLEIENEKEG